MSGKLQTNGSTYLSKREADKTPPASKKRGGWAAYRRGNFRILIHTSYGETSIRREETYHLHRKPQVKRKVRRATAEGTFMFN